MRISFVLSVLQFALSVVIGADLLKSRYFDKIIYRKYRLWLLLSAVVVLSGSLFVMQTANSWFLITFVVAVVVVSIAAVRYTKERRTANALTK
jgi:hypothetical protein